MERSNLPPAKEQEISKGEMVNKNNTSDHINLFFALPCKNFECNDRLVCPDGSCPPCCILQLQQLSCVITYGSEACYDVLMMTPGKYQRTTEGRS